MPGRMEKSEILSPSSSLFLSRLYLPPSIVMAFSISSYVTLVDMGMVSTFCSTITLWGFCRENNRGGRLARCFSDNTIINISASRFSSISSQGKYSLKNVQFPMFRASFSEIRSLSAAPYFSRMEELVAMAFKDNRIETAA